MNTPRIAILLLLTLMVATPNAIAPPPGSAEEQALYGQVGILGANGGQNILCRGVDKIAIETGYTYIMVAGASSSSDDTFVVQENTVAEVGNNNNAITISASGVQGETSPFPFEDVDLIQHVNYTNHWKGAVAFTAGTATSVTIGLIGSTSPGFAPVDWIETGTTGRVGEITGAGTGACVGAKIGILYRYETPTRPLFGSDGTIWGAVDQDTLSAELGVSSLSLGLFYGLIVVLVLTVAGFSLAQKPGAIIGAVGGVSLAGAFDFWPAWAIAFLGILVVAGLFLQARRG